MPTTEFQSITNLLKRAIDDIKKESKSVSIAYLSFVISILALIISSLIAVSAWDDAKDAKKSVDFELVKTREEVKRLTDEIRLESMYQSEVDLWLKETHRIMQEADIKSKPLPKREAENE